MEHSVSMCVCPHRMCVYSNSLQQIFVEFTLLQFHVNLKYNYLYSMQIVMKYISVKKNYMRDLYKKKKKVKINWSDNKGWGIHFLELPLRKGVVFYQRLSISEILKMHIWISNHADWQLRIVIFINVGILTT